MVKFGNKLESSRKDGILANTDNIYDKRTGEMQETINQKIANVSPADEEDLTKTIDEEGRSVTKFADRSYSPSNFSGKGYKILRKNIQKVSLAVTNITVNSVPSADGYVSFIINGIETHVDLVVSTDNTTALVAQKIATKLSETMTEYEVSANASSVTLTRKFGGVASSSSFSANSTGVSCVITDTTKSELRNLITAIMLNQSNTIYEIRYDFDMNGETIDMPKECKLEFKGGSLTNGLLYGNNTICNNHKISKCKYFGTWITESGSVFNMYLNKGLKAKYSKLDLCYPIGYWNKETDVSKLRNDIVNVFSNGFNSIGIILGIASNSENKVELNPDLDKILKELQSTKCKVSYLKFHIDGGIWKQDRNDVTLFRLYSNVVIETVKSALEYIDFDTVYIINEWIETSNTGISADMKKQTLSLIENIKSLGKNVGITYSMRNYWNADKDIFSSLDKPAINYYPTLTYLDEKVKDDMDFSSLIYSDLRNYVCAKNAIDGTKHLYITESGCPPYTKSLQAPYMALGDKVEGHSPQMHVFFKSILNNVANKELDINSFNIWYGSYINQGNVKEIIKDLFYE